MVSVPVAAAGWEHALYAFLLRVGLRNPYRVGSWREHCSGLAWRLTAATVVHRMGVPSPTRSQERMRCQSTAPHPQVKPKRLGDYLEVMSKAVFRPACPGRW